MKPNLTVLALLLTAIPLYQCEKDDTEFKIPDNNFLNALIELEVDTDGDGLISPYEAEAIISLYIDSDSISDLTGIEKFIHLDTLNCSYNQISSLNLSDNISLKVLLRMENQLKRLDV